ncbi:MAG: cytochrome P450, partial [Ketobacteraceae bacterium]|nr:cytochrome P450 [Ketobacteraceae bacterium]
QFYKRFINIGRKGLITSEGKHWQKQRKLLNPFFTQRSLKIIYSDIVESNRAMNARWNQKYTQGEVFDVSQEIFRLALDVVGRSLFGQELADQQEKISGWTDVFLEYLVKIPVPIISEPWFPSPINLKMKKALSELEEFCRGIIQARKSDPKKHDDFLQELIDAEDEDSHERMTEQELVEEIISFLLAGHETTAHAISWTLFHLSQNPECLSKARDEIASISPSGEPAFEDLNKLEYVSAIIKEVLRLNPTAWVITRAASEDQELGNAHIRKGEMVLFTPYTLHRNPKYWDEPEVFRPERFLDESSKTRHRFAYIPFGGGPRICIGNNFAMIEMIYTICNIIWHYDVEVVSPESVKPLPLLTLQMENGLMTRISPRTSA